MSIPDEFDIRGPLPQQAVTLEASAGTGKTYALTALAVRYVAEGELELPELLLVTFTRAASAELRERVRLQLQAVLAAADAALANPENWAAEVDANDPVIKVVVGSVAHDRQELQARRDRLFEASGRLDDATITTIHGFCQRMLDHAALEAGVDFDTELLENDDELLDEIVDDWIALQLRDGPVAWVRYLFELTGVDKARLTELARWVEQVPSLHLRPELSVSEADPPQRAWTEAVRELAEAWHADGREGMRDLVTRLGEQQAFDSPKQTTYKEKKLDAQADELEAWLAECGEYPDASVFANKEAPTAHPVKYFSHTGLAAMLAEGVESPTHPVLDAAESVWRARHAPAAVFLHRAARYIRKELDERKRQRGVLTFSDYLNRLAEALARPETKSRVREMIRDRYAVALIDEFQDTDPVQWEIFRALFELHERLVLVGDPKQAIYSFRGGDVHTYVHARDQIAGLQTLPTNHRSDASYVEATNRLFGRGGLEFGSGIPYRQVRSRHPDRLRHPPDATPVQATALRVRYVREAAGEQKDSGEIKKPWADQHLPDDVATVVAELLRSRSRLDAEGEGQEQKLRARDIAVLVRTNRRAELFRRGLREAGIPAVIFRAGSVYATDEASAMQRLLDALLRPGADRPAATAAASLLFGADAPTITRQRDAAERADVGEGTSSAADEEPADGHTHAADVPMGDESEQRWDDWLSTLREWSGQWREQGILATVRRVFAEHGVAERLLGQPGGERSVTNLWHLVELLHTAEVGEHLSPEALSEWLRVRCLEAQEDDESQPESELRLEEDAAAVQISTIHGSKGLQYPVVLCPDLWDGKLYESKILRFHEPEAQTPREAITLDVDPDVKSPSRQRSQQLAEDEQRAESLRRAYVALTRAQHAGVAWWGRFGDAAESPLARLLHGDDAARTGDQDALDRVRERVKAAPETELLDDLRQLAEASQGTIAVESLDSLGPPEPWQPTEADSEELAAREFTRGDVDRAWTRTSFSGLTRRLAGVEEQATGASHDVTAFEEAGAGDEGAQDSAESLPAQQAVSQAAGVEDEHDREDRHGRLAGPEVALSRFPRGPGPGSFLHELLERLDFAAADEEVLAKVSSLLEPRHGIAAAHRPEVVAGLRAAITTPLGPFAADARLADVPWSQRLNELSFELPLAGGHEPRADPATLTAVAGLLARSGDPLVAAYAESLDGRAPGGALRGFLAGEIDLLARLPNGQFCVVDYKSNWLGDRQRWRSVARHYRPDVLASEMVDHDFVLQALLYLVAAHRYLRWRLGDAYRYDEHVAGAAYLFLRGMTGPDVAVEDGRPCGVATVCPEGELVESLSALLDGAEQAVRGAA